MLNVSSDVVTNHMMMYVSLMNFHITITLSSLLWPNGHTVLIPSNHFHVPTPRSRITVKLAIPDLGKCKMGKVNGIFDCWKYQYKVYY